MADTDAKPSEQPTGKTVTKNKGYTTSTWGGRTLYECDVLATCPFDTFDKDTMERHISLQHGGRS